MNHHSNRGTYSRREEDAADWRAGRYLVWLMQNDALSVKGFTEAANLFFQHWRFPPQLPPQQPQSPI